MFAGYWGGAGTHSAQCTASNYTGYDKICFSPSRGDRPPTVHTGLTLGDCCSETIKANAWDYTYFASNQTCLVFDPRAYEHAHAWLAQRGVIFKLGTAFEWIGTDHVVLKGGEVTISGN